MKIASLKVRIINTEHINDKKYEQNYHSDLKKCENIKANVLNKAEILKEVTFCH